MSELTKSDALAALEDWMMSGSKGRFVSTIEHDDGYGASCWHVEIGSSGAVPQGWYKDEGGLRKVFASETTFFEHAKLPPNVVIVWDGDDVYDDWPGLAPTIMAAIKRAEELGL